MANPKTSLGTYVYVYMYIYIHTEMQRDRTATVENQMEKNLERISWKRIWRELGE